MVDDGSKDNTCHIVLNDYVKRYGCDKIRLLRLFKNHGKGGAVSKGMQRARGQTLLMVDADGATKFSDLARLEIALRDCTGGTPDQAGVVVGSRAHLQDESIAKVMFHAACQWVALWEIFLCLESKVMHIKLNLPHCTAFCASSSSGACYGRS